jgi:hypothetical protein
MIYVLIILLAWMLFATMVCVFVCMAGSRFSDVREPQVTRRGMPMASGLRGRGHRHAMHVPH